MLHRNGKVFIQKMYSCCAVMEICKLNVIYRLSSTYRRCVFEILVVSEFRFSMRAYCIIVPQHNRRIDLIVIDFSSSKSQFLELNKRPTVYF